MRVYTNNQIIITFINGDDIPININSGSSTIDIINKRS